MFSVNYKRIASEDWGELLNFLEQFNTLHNSAEGISSLEYSNDFILFEYFKVIPSKDLIYNKNDKTVEIGHLDKYLASKVFINKELKYLVFYGNKTACKLFESFLSVTFPYPTTNYHLDFKLIMDKFINLDYSIQELEFKKVNLFNTPLKSLSLAFNNVSDAKKIYKTIGIEPSSLKLTLKFYKDIFKVKIDLEKGQLLVNYNNVSTINLEFIKDYCVNLLEG
jgi:hypothetical protein